MQPKARKLSVAVSGGVLGVIISAMSIPFCVLAGGGIGRSNGESCSMPSSTGSAPTVLGESALDQEQLGRWWAALRRGQPAALDVDVSEVIEIYLAEGDAEGVRGDLAWAQAIHETGYFTSADTMRNNFAGIAHPGGAGAGASFPDVAVGVRAHIQLLKKFAAGNEVQLASPDVAPDAGARATTWADLAGTWATDPAYWTSVSLLYSEMRDATADEGGFTAEPDLCASDEASASSTQDGAVSSGDLSLATVRGITVNAEIADDLEQLLAAAEADGLLLSGYGYRSHEQQIALREAHCGEGHYNVFEKPASRCSPPTARPGTSKHEVGLAIDFANCSTHTTRCWRWLDDHAAEFGFFNLAEEPWHWSVDGQ